jgi:hypothetical protein
MKFAQDDTVYFEKRFPEPAESFYAILDNNNRKTLDSFLLQFQTSNYDTTYMEHNLSDGGSLKFYLTTDTLKKWVFIYGNEGPKELYTFAIWLKDLKEHQSFKPTTTKADYGDLRYILFPKLPPPRKD